MTNHALGAGEPGAPAKVTVRPQMPSITASALEESLRLVARARRLLAGWLARS